MGEPWTEYVGCWVADGLLAVATLTPEAAVRLLGQMDPVLGLGLGRLRSFDDTDLRCFSLASSALHGADRVVVALFLDRVRAAGGAQDAGDRAFFPLPEPPPAVGVLRMSYIVLCVGADDLFWEISARHGEGLRETARLSRERLEAVATATTPESS